MKILSPSAFLFFLLPLSSFALAAPQDPDPSASLFQRVSERYEQLQKGISFYYYSLDDRKQVLSELFRSIELDYAQLLLKIKTLGIDFDALKAKALAEEDSFGEAKDNLEKAKSNLLFLDRVNKIVATFQDTHFAISARQLVSPVVIPFKIAKTAGKYLVVSRYSKLLAYLALDDDSFQKIGLGDEVVSIDGVEPAKAVKQLEPYISASTELFRESRAIESLTMRNFALPEKSFAVVRFKKADGRTLSLKFPWMYRDTARGDQALFFKQLSFSPYEQLRISWDKDQKKWISSPPDLDNPSYMNSLPRLMEEHIFHGPKDKNAVLKIGYLLKNGMSYGVLQINSLMEDKVAEGDDKPGDFLAPIQTFIKVLQSVSSPLILDLRANPGGRLDYAEAVPATLLESGKSIPGEMMAFRITKNILSITDSKSKHRVQGEELKPGPTTEDIFRLINDATDAGKPYSAAYSTGDILPDPKVGGFTQKVVALVGPNCVSGCDIISMLLKSSGRATILGLPSNGTGGGFESSDSENSTWTDSLRILQSNIPNFLFGRPGGPVGQYIFDSQAEALCSEGKPTLPDVNYEPSAADLLKGSEKMLEQAIELLEQNKTGT